MRPFWIHQLVEYLIGVALVAQGLQSPNRWYRRSPGWS